MERINFKFCLTVILIFLGFAGFCEENVPVTSLVTPQNVDFDICTKTYNMPADKLLYLSMSAINANKFKIVEIQSKTGYILFTAASKQYLASVVKIDSMHSMLKITPTNNNYFFPPGVVLNFFKYIDLNLTEQMVSVPKV